MYYKIQNRSTATLIFMREGRILFTTDRMQTKTPQSSWRFILTGEGVDVLSDRNFLTALSSSAFV